MAKLDRARITGFLAALPLIGGMTLQRRQAAGPGLALLSFFGGLAVGILIGALTLIAAGVPADDLLDELVVQVFLTSDGLAQTVVLATPLLLAGLSSAVASRIRFWNIGIEGQLWMGAIAAAGVALFHIGPEPLRLPLMMLAACIAGACWIALPLFLKLRLGVSEIVLTLMLSNVAYLVMQHLLFGAWQDPSGSFPISPRFDDAATLPGLGWGDVHAGIVIALIAGLTLWVLMERTRAGFHANAIGLNPVAARAAGIPVAATVVLFVLLSGALSGLAGGVIVAGTEHRLTQFIGINMTFSGIVIAFLARFNALGTIVAALAIAGIYNAGGTLKVFYSVSDGVVVLVEGAVLMCVLIGQFFSAYRIEFARAPAAPDAAEGEAA